MARIHCTSLGCAKNRIDSEILLGHLVGLEDAAGTVHEIVADPATADVLLVNTCAFLLSAREESIAAILEAATYKEARPGVKLVVAGCLPQRYREELAVELPEVDLFVGTGQLDQLATVLAPPERRPPDRLAVAGPHYQGHDEAPRLLTTRPHTAYVRVSEGCSRACAFCAIPLIRGPQQSRSADGIVREVERLTAAGVVEVNLVAQDLTAYGDDLPGSAGLAPLVRRLARVPGLSWLRLLYAYPNRVTDELLSAMAEEETVCAYLDVPLQHVDDAILKAMRRGTPEALVRALVPRVRARVPGITLRTTLITGFPGEDDRAFARLCDFVREAQFERLGVFAFSPEDDTVAATLPHQVPTEVAEERRDILMQIQQDVSRAANKRLVGRVVPVLVEGASEETDLLLAGRTAGQAPEVDGVVYINEGYAPPGQIVPVEILDAWEYDLLGRIG